MTIGSLYRRVIAFVGARAHQLGLVEDETFNVLTGGEADQTFSLREAEARKAGEPIACYICWCLSWMVQPDHCAKMLAHKPIPHLNALRAAAWLTLFLSLPYDLWRWPIITLSGIAAFCTITVAIYEIVTIYEIGWKQ